MVEASKKKILFQDFSKLYYNRRLFQLCCNYRILVVERLIKRTNMSILIHLIMIQQLPTRVLKLFIKRKIVSLLSFLYLVQRTTKLQPWSYLKHIYIYIRTSPGIRDISIVASSACRGNNSAPTRYTGSACGGGVDGKPGQNTGRSFPSPFPPNFVVPSFSGIDEGESAGIQLSRQNRRGTRF